ncbi:MAG: EF-Tu/IF-2/RF-3 family GTPase, partial [Acidiferrobacterales bacterium]
KKKTKKKVKKKAKKKAVKKAARKAKPAATVKPAAPAAPQEERIGTVTHYFSHLSVAVIALESGSLKEGDTIHVQGHTSDFRQRVGSMEVEHVTVSEAYRGQSFGLKVTGHAREHDVVYKVRS